MNFHGLVEDIHKFNYLTDWMFYGPSDKLFTMYDRCNLSDITVEDIMCEMRVISSYLVNKGKKINMSFEYLSQEFGIIMGQMDRLGIDLYSLKMLMNYSKMHVNKSKGAIPGVYLSD
jgi:hypothetical protein